MSNQSSWPNADIAFIEQMLERWRADPAAVDPGWCDLFVSLGETPDAPGANGAAPVNGEDEMLRGTAVAMLLHRAYRERGHLIADSDPLGLDRREPHRDLDPAGFGLGADVRGLPISPDRQPGFSATSVGALEAELRATYCGTLSAEFMHLDDPEPRDWLAWAMETGYGAPPAVARPVILDQLIEAETFEHFMQTKLPTMKRFGMEGSESQMPLCERLLHCAADAGVDEVALGPMHRGRTTFMALFMEKPLAAIFSEFQGRPWHAPDLGIAGDVTYHMGHSTDRSVGGATLHISMASHPSHVETVIPVALGKARARQRMGNTRVLGLMMHTDAGFAGQGIVAECFQLAGLEGYDTGGSIHVIANNQVGFTTRTADARTSRYCSDMGKIVQAPVLRVNGDDPEAAYRAAGIAVEFWHRFGRDIIIDLVCYRRQGHNELDEPRYTQPQMYAAIDGLESVRTLYAGRLLADGAVTPDWCETSRQGHWQRFAVEFESAEAYRPNKPGAFERHWTGLRARDLEQVGAQPDTGVEISRLRDLDVRSAQWPAGFTVHRKLAAQLDARAKTVAEGEGIAWATAETLAFASLLVEGVPIRLTGEDTRRGTFSQRHGVLHDQTTGAEHIPLNHLEDGQARLEIYDSPLSEEAVLGFEYGHSLADPNTLVLWEAQFGDFANTAQVMIDQYIAPGEEKWLRSSGLVLLLPHGMEGGGPEHSSARLERFLQLCAKGNMHVTNCTTPANHFHAIRRQMCRDYRKPLIAMTPKLLLRHRAAVSDLADMGPATRFEPVLADAETREGANAVVVCSGRVYYDLEAARRDRGVDDVVIVRIEELYPFPEAQLRETLRPHPQAEIVWCQDEPENMGAWSFVDRRLQAVLRDLGRPSVVRYAGRPANPSPAPGFKVNYEREQRAVIDAAFGSAPRGASSIDYSLRKPCPGLAATVFLVA